MASKLFIYLSFHEPRRLRLPAEELQQFASVDAMRERCFDEAETDRSYQIWLEQICQPYAGLLQEAIEGGARFLINVSGPLLQKLGQDGQGIAGQFLRLLGDPRITPVCSDLSNSIALYLDIRLFQREMEKGRQLLLELTGRQPELAVAPLMAINAEIHHLFGRLGFRGVIVDGGRDLLQGREVSRVYRAGEGPILIPRAYDLSHCLALALRAARNDFPSAGIASIADKVAARDGKFVVIGHSVSSIAGAATCGALGQWLHEMQWRGVEFPDVGNDNIGAEDRYVPNLPLPAIPSVSSEYGGMRYFFGHPSQQSVFCLMRQAFWAARLSRQEDVVALAVDAAQWDILELLHQCAASNGNALQPHYLAPGVLERIGTNDVPQKLPLLVNDYYQGLVRGITASYL